MTRKRARGIAAAAAVLCAGLAPAGAQALPSQTPDPDAFVPNGAVNAVARGTGVTYIGGGFSALSLPAKGLARLSPSSGQTAPPSPEVAGGSNLVIASAPDGAGGVFIGGDFTSVEGVARQNLAHVLADGSVDPAFDPGTVDQPVFALAVSGPAVYAGGDFENIGGQARSHLAKLSIASGNATAWNPGPSGNRVQALAVSGSAIYAAGDFSTIGGLTRPGLAKLSTTSGNAFSSFNASSTGGVFALAVSGSELYAGGQFNGANSIGGQDRNRIAKLSATTGNAFSAWNPNANSDVFALALDGTSLYAGGAFNGVDSIGGEDRERIAKLSTSSGNAFSTWDPNSNGSVQSLAVSGSVVFAGGGFTIIGSQPRVALAKLSATSGNAFAAFDPHPDSDVRTVSASGSNVFAGGDFSSVNRTERDFIAALDDNGVPTAFNPDANGQVRAIAVNGSDVYVGGDFFGTNSIGGQTRNRIAKLSAASGNAFSGFNAGTVDGSVRALDVDGTNIFVGGQFGNIGGQTRDGIAKLSTTSGNAFSGFNAGDVTGIIPGVNALAVSGGSVFVGGFFTAIGGQTRDNIARLAATSGNASTTFAPNADNTVVSLALSGNDLYAGGLFDNIGGQVRSSIAKLSATSGNAFSAWNPNAGGVANPQLSALQVADGVVYAGGNFTSLGGTTRNRLGAVSATSGNAFATFNPNVGTPSVSALAADGGNLYAGGNFTAVGGDFARPFYAQFSAP